MRRALAVDPAFPWRRRYCAAPFFISRGFRLRSPLTLSLSSSF